MGIYVQRRYRFIIPHSMVNMLHSCLDKHSLSWSWIHWSFLNLIGAKVVLGLNSNKCLNHLCDLYQNLSHYLMRDLLLHKAGLLGCLLVGYIWLYFFSSLMHFLQPFDKMTYFMTVVTMKPILVRSSTLGHLTLGLAWNLPLPWLLKFSWPLLLHWYLLESYLLGFWEGFGLISYHFETGMDYGERV